VEERGAAFTPVALVHAFLVVEEIAVDLRAVRTAACAADSGGGGGGRGEAGGRGV
jgi:hypothetical protein